MMVYEECHTTCTTKTVILVMSTFVSSGRFYDGVCVYHLFSLMCCILCVCLRPVFCVPGVVIVSGLSLRSSSSVLCARRCHCIWIVPSVFVQCFVCPALSLYLDCPFGLRPVFCVPGVVTVSGLSLRFSLAFIPCTV